MPTKPELEKMLEEAKAEIERLRERAGPEVTDQSDVIDMLRQDKQNLEIERDNLRDKLRRAEERGHRAGTLHGSVDDLNYPR